MDLTYDAIVKMIDLSAVRAEHGEAEIDLLAETARRYRVGSVHALPAFVPRLMARLGDAPEMIVGAPVGFPSGGQTARIKAAEARELVEMGCAEIDMVINIGKLRSGYDGEVLDEMGAVIAAAEGRPVKVILECYYLDDDQIRRGCDLAIAAGARYVKTGTGWAPGGATLENIALIKAHVGDAIGIKAAGGIRSLATLLEMYRLGARRFGIGLSAIGKVLEGAHF
jgi:deoxyribose-phosphate aldolase